MRSCNEPVTANEPVDPGNEDLQGLPDTRRDGGPQEDGGGGNTSPSRA